MAKTVFLDIDGVITDSALLADDYTAQLGAVMAPALGGTPEEWGRANAATYPTVLKRQQETGRPDDDPIVLWDREHLESVQAMCDWLGVPRPSDDECVRLGRGYNVYVRRNSRAVFPTAAEMVRTLAQTHELHMATGNLSWAAEAQLEGMGVRELVGFPCGPDLIGVAKASEAYYARLFEEVGVAPRDAVVVDDSPVQLERARAVGASTVLVTRDEVERGTADAVVADPSKVAAAVTQLR